MKHFWAFIFSIHNLKNLMWKQSFKENFEQGKKPTFDKIKNFMILQITTISYNKTHALKNMCFSFNNCDPEKSTWPELDSIWGSF